MKLGILGNGQLGRMAALAAARLGVEIVIYAPDADGPANQVARESHVGAWDDEAALEAFANSVDAVTYEFENVPVATARFIETIKPVYPQPHWLERAQHRLVEKNYFQSKGLPVAPFAKFTGQALSKDTILKTCAGGYDGKGQWRVKAGDALPELPNVELIAEEKIDLAGELSVIVCRDQFGNTDCYAPAWNVHKDGILYTSTVPAPSHADVAKTMALRLIEDEDFVGVLALELFLTKDGALLVNEMAPRPHNSGHWTIDACACSQFENQVRAAVGLPLGGTQRHSDAVMTNLIGNDVDKVPDLLKQTNACVHLYGKNETRPHRKMGHVTVLNVKSN